MTAVDACWGKIPSLGNISAYVSAIQQFPIMTHEEEQEAAVSDNHADRMKLVLSHLRLAYTLAREFQYVMPISDAIQEANLGLLRAAEKFQAIEARFSTFASIYITSSLKSAYIANYGQTKISQSKPVRKVFWHLPREKRTIKVETGRENLNESDIKRLAEKLSVGEDEVRIVEQFMTASNSPVLLNHNVFDDDASHTSSSVSKALSDSSSDPAEILMKLEHEYFVSHVVPEFIKTLSDREQFILNNRLLAENKMSLIDIAPIFGVSLERIRQIEAAAIKKLKAAFAEHA